MRRREWTLRGLAATVALSSVLLAGCPGPGPPPGPLAVGSPAPDFSLPSLDGATVTARSLAGQIVVLNFWATWCAPCRKEIPELAEFSATPGVKVVGIALDVEGREAVAPFVQENGMRYTILLGDDALFQRFDGFGIPHTVVLDRTLRVARIFRGPVTRAALAEAVRQIGAPATARPAG